MVKSFPNNSVGELPDERGEERVTTSYTQRVKDELRRDVSMRNWQNEQQPVYTRQMTVEEMATIFGDNPDAIKNISRDSDEKEWRRLK